MLGIPKIQSKLLYKYILSYMLILFVPLVTMSFIIYQDSVGSLRDGIEQSNIEKLNQVKTITDERMQELEKIALRISYDPSLTPYMVNDGFYGGEAINELDNYKANSSIIEELFLHYNGDPKMFSTQGVYSLETFEKKYHFSQLNHTEINKMIGSDAPFITPAEPVKVNDSKEDRFLIYIYPIKRDVLTPYGSVTYFIEESAITSLIKDTLGDFQGNAYIFDNNHKVLTSSLNSTHIGKSGIKKLANIQNGVSSIHINGEEYSVVSVKSNLSGWTFVTVIPAKQFFKKVVNLQRFILMILASIALSGIGFSILLGRKQYRPIHNMIDFIKTNRISNVGNMNELDTIKDTIHKVFKDHASLSEKINSQAPFVRHQYLMRIINGKIADESEINSLLDRHHIPMESGGYFVAVVSLKDIISQRQEEMIQFLETLTLTGAACYGVEIGYKQAIALIVSIGHDLIEDSGKIIEELKELLNNKLKVEPVLSVGNVYTEKSRINRSFIEALAALEYRFMHGHKHITRFEEITASLDKTIGYPKEEQIKFIQSLKQGDRIVALETLNQMLTLITAQDISMYMVKCICFDIINTVLKAAIEAGLVENVYDLNQIVTFQSIKELENTLKPVIVDICKEVEHKTERSNTKLGNEIIKYIQANFTHYDLSLEGIAQTFNLSTSYLSRFLKEQIGMTFTQYVWNLRIEEVKRKLADTDETIRDIVLEAGYMDVANFTRKFRKAEGVTPGQYRSLYGKCHILG